MEILGDRGFGTTTWSPVRPFLAVSLLPSSALPSTIRGDGGCLALPEATTSTYRVGVSFSIENPTTVISAEIPCRGASPLIARVIPISLPLSKLAYLLCCGVSAF